MLQIKASNRFTGLWRSWERASMALKRSRVRTPSGPPFLPFWRTHIRMNGSSILQSGLSGKKRVMQRWSLDVGDNDAGNKKVRSCFSTGVRYSLRCFLLGLFTLILAPNTAQAQAPSLVVGPNAMFFGDELPVTQVLTVAGDGGPVTFSATASVTTPAGSNWLSFSPTSGVTPLQLFVTVNPTGLNIGTYFGSITIVGDAGNSPLTVPVTLGVGSFMGGDPPARLVVSPVFLSFLIKYQEKR